MLANRIYLSHSIGAKNVEVDQADRTDVSDDIVRSGVDIPGRPSASREEQLRDMDKREDMDPVTDESIDVFANGGCLWQFYERRDHYFVRDDRGCASE